MFLQCAWCGAPLPLREPPTDCQISYGICLPCVARHMPEFLGDVASVAARDVCGASPRRGSAEEP